MTAHQLGLGVVNHLIHWKFWEASWPTNAWPLTLETMAAFEVMQMSMRDMIKGPDLSVIWILDMDWSTSEEIWRYPTTSTVYHYTRIAYNSLFCLDYIIVNQRKKIVSLKPGVWAIISRNNKNQGFYLANNSPLASHAWTRTLPRYTAKFKTSVHPGIDVRNVTDTLINDVNDHRVWCEVYTYMQSFIDSIDIFWFIREQNKIIFFSIPSSILLRHRDTCEQHN
jgi:hypothetical protein